MREISTDDAPDSIGPYSQAIEANGFIFVSGQGPADPNSREVVSHDIREQTQQVLENITKILNAAGTDADSIVKVTVYLDDMDDYDDVNDVYATYLNKPFPARAAIEVANLPIDIAVEMEIIAESPVTDKTGI